MPYCVDEFQLELIRHRVTIISGPSEDCTDCQSSSSSSSSSIDCSQFVECGCVYPDACSSADCGLADPNFVFDCSICECIPSSPSVSITGLNGTGLNYNPSLATTDAFWSVVALPVSFSGSQSTPYPAWIFTGGSPNNNIPPVWLGGSSNSGVNGSHWIGLLENDSTSLVQQGEIGQYYSMIYATKFYASRAGSATLSLYISVDNRATVFVGGTPTVGSDQPTITGGQQLGSVIWNKDWQNDPNGNTLPRAFQILQGVSGLVNVVEGENTLYIVVDDALVAGTTFGQTGLLVSLSPMPTTPTL